MKEKFDVFATENEEPVDAGLTSDEEVAEPASQEELNVEETVGDMTGDLDEVEDTLDQVANVNSDMEEMEAMKEVAEISLQDGGEGLDDFSAEANVRRVTEIESRHQISLARLKNNFASENFATGKESEARIDATKLAIEGMTNTLGRFGKAHMNATLGVWERTSNFFEKHFTAYGSIRSDITALKTKAKNLKGKASKEAIEFPGTQVGSLGLSGKFTFSDVMSRLTAQTEAGGKAAGVSQKLISTLSKLASVDLKTWDSNSRSKFTADLKPVKLSTPDKPLAGGMVLELVQVEGLLFLKKSKVAPSKATASCSVASLSDIEKALDELLKLLDNTKSLTRTYSTQQKELNGIVKKAESNFGKYTPKVGSEKQATEADSKFKEIQTVFNSLGVTSPGLLSAIAKSDLECCRVGVRILSRMLNAYSSAEVNAKGQPTKK